MLKKILLSIFGAIILLVIFIAMKPDEFRVSRKAVIFTFAPIIFEQINDLHKFNDWSPWAKIDPNAKVSYEGAEVGVGSIFNWSSQNDEVGEGKMTIIESQPDLLVKFQLDFYKPFAGTSTAELALKPMGNRTEVVWSMYGKSNFLSKAMSLVFDCDKMVGEKFEAGLANLKAISESAKK